ncbi:MAG: hypothetical protein AAGI38_03920 [Bacteroidota bacterium]
MRKGIFLLALLLLVLDLSAQRCPTFARRNPSNIYVFGYVMPHLRYFEVPWSEWGIGIMPGIGIGKHLSRIVDLQMSLSYTPVSRDNFFRSDPSVSPLEPQGSYFEANLETRLRMEGVNKYDRPYLIFGGSLVFARAENIGLTSYEQHYSYLKAGVGVHRKISKRLRFFGEMDVRLSPEALGGVTSEIAPVYSAGAKLGLQFEVP